MNNEIVIETIPELKEANIDIIEEFQEEKIEVQQEKIILEYRGADKYKGEYEFTPLAYQQQEVQTKDKILEQNLIIKEVPFFEVSNIEEGTTIYIASEV